MPPRLSVDIVGAVESGWEPFIVLATAVKTVGIASILLGLTGCATTSVNLSDSDAEKVGGLVMMTACLNKYAAKLDDGKTDPAKLAVAIVKGPCAKQHAALIEVARHDMPPEKRRLFDQNIYSISYTAAQSAILQHRMAR